MMEIMDDLLRRCAEDGVQKVVVGAVIRLGNGFLLLERRSDDFMGGLVELPSGGVEAGETLLEALAREVAEETGLEIKRVVAYLGEFDYVSGSGKRARQLNFLVEVLPGQVVLNEHCAYHVYCGQQLNISPQTQAILSAASALADREPPARP
jgi:8-oxo-dGTP diphosphatase